MSTQDSPLVRLATSRNLRRCVQSGRGGVMLGRVWIRGKGTVRIGDGVVLDGRYEAIELHVLEPESEIVLGDEVHLDGGVSIEAVLSVRIGARTRVGALAKIMDNNFHPLLGNRHERPPSQPVSIGEDVDIEARAILLAGAQIGDGATVGAGTVISKRLFVPAGRTARGSPAVLA